MKIYIWQNPDFPNFIYDNDIILPLLAKIRLSQGLLLGKMRSIGFENIDKTLLNVLTEDVIKSNEIEGVRFNTEQVRSSIARRLGINIGGDIYVNRDVQGTVDMMLDATQNYNLDLTEDRIFAWQSAIFPEGRSGLYKISTGKYRDDANEPMQVVSGPIGHEKIHYEAPPAKILKKEMKKLFDYVNNKNDNVDLVIKAAVVHLWFIILHPFEDGNGRITRALTDMLLAGSEDSCYRFYSMSSEIQKKRDEYYKILELTQKSSLDITQWIVWFLNTMNSSIENSEILIQDIIKKTEFWQKHKGVSMNERQIKILNMLLDDFEGKLTTSKWAKICKCSQDAATRDINNLIDKGVLIKQGLARATHYVINF